MAKEIWKFLSYINQKLAYRPVTHVIFDCDGTLLDTETVHKQIFQNLCKKHNGESMGESDFHKIIGSTDSDAVAKVIEICRLQVDQKTLTEEFYEDCKIYLPKCTMMPGAARLVQHFSSHGIPIAVATSSSEFTMKLKTVKHRKIFDLFHHVVMANSDPEVKKGKPAPDTFLICAQRFDQNPPPEKCLVFEDSYNGVMGAKNANMQVVMIPAPTIDPKLTDRATMVLRSPNDFKPEIFGLPPRCKCKAN